MANTTDIFKRLKINGDVAKETQHSSQSLNKQEKSSKDLAAPIDDDLLDLSQFIDDDEFDIERLLP